MTGRISVNIAAATSKKKTRFIEFFIMTPSRWDKKGHNPITKKLVDFKTTPVAKAQYKLLESIKRTPNFALRLGKTVWRNKSWVLNSVKFDALLSKKISVDALTEQDVRPLIEQKAVDMKMGLDIASIATKRLADTLIIITGDADIVPALKLARQEGMMVGLDPLWNPIQPELSEHVDFITTKINKKQNTTIGENSCSQD